MSKRIRITNKLPQVIGLNIWSSSGRTALTHFSLQAKSSVVLEGWQVSQDVSDKRAAGIISVMVLS
jgi:hypothetical protein